MQTFELSEAKKNQVASEIAQRILDNAQVSQPVDGEHLQRFTAFPQINQFLLFQVYQVWQLQIARFRHSYFDFDHPEVEKQLQVLQNLLSRHITIKAADMKPLLRNAVYNNLSLLLDPEESLRNFFFAQQEQVPRSRYAGLAPFFHDFDFAVGSILRYHEKQGLDTIDKDLFAVKLNKVFELFEERGNDLDSYRASRIEALTGRSLQTLADEDEHERKAEKVAEQRLMAEAEEQARLEAEKARKAAEAEAEAARAEAEARRQAEEAETRRRQTSFFDSLSVNAPVIELDSPPEVEEPLLPLAPVVDEQVEEIELPAEEPAVEAVVESHPEPEKPVEEEKTVQTIADKLAATRETVADKLKDAKNTLADNFTKEGKENKTLIERLANGQPETEKPVEIAAPAPQEVKEESKVEEIVEETKNTVEEKLKETLPENAGGSVLDRFRKQNSEPAPEVEEAKPKTLADRLREEKSREKEAAPKIKVAAPLDANGEIVADDIPVHKQYQFVQKVFGGNHAALPRHHR
ncbi:MAG: hypothetical protein R3B47_00495 [Bacteroidia bacterium]